MATGITKILNKDDKSCENQALSAREFPRLPSGPKKKKKLPLKNKVEGGRANYLKVVENLKEEVMAKCHRPVT
jgi:hypothetical protein